MLIAKPCPSLPIVSSRVLTCSSPLNVVGNHKFPFPKVAETIHSFVSDMLGCPGSMGHWIHRVVSYYSWLISCGVIHLHLTNLTCPTLDLDLHALTRSKTVVVGGWITNPQKFIDNKSTGKTHQFRTVPDQGTSAKRALAMADGLFFERAPGTADASIFWQGLIIVKGNPHALETVLFLGVASLKGSGNVKMSRGVLKEKWETAC